MTQQDQVVPAAPPKSTAAPAPVPPPSSVRIGTSISVSSTLARLVIPLFAVIAALAFVAVATLRWDAWVGSAAIQTTDDAYVRADLTRLSSRVASEVLSVAVDDFQRVKQGQLLIQIGQDGSLVISRTGQHDRVGRPAVLTTAKDFPLVAPGGMLSRQRCP